MDCLFCQIIAGVIPCHRVYEDDLTLAFLDIFPKTKGHVLVVPKVHSAGIYDVAPEQMHACADTAQRMAISMQHSLHTTGVNIFQNTGESAQQTVHHYHVHVMPRYDDNQAITFVKEEKDSPFDDIAQVIKAGLR